MRVVQVKTGAELWIPEHCDLAAEQRPEHVVRRQVPQPSDGILSGALWGSSLGWFGA